MMSTNAQDQGREPIEAEIADRGASRDAGQGSSVTGAAPQAERAFRGMKIRSGVRAGHMIIPT